MTRSFTKLARPRLWGLLCSSQFLGRLCLCRLSVPYDWMEAHSKVVLNDGSKTRAARNDQSAGISTSHVSLVDTVIASHGKPLQRLTQTTSRCCLSGIRTVSWSVAIPEDDPITPKRIGLYSTNASLTVTMRCHQSSTYPNV